MSDDDLQEVREWLASEKAGMDYFAKRMPDQAYPGALAINQAERLLAEVDRLRQLHPEAVA